MCDWYFKNFTHKEVACKHCAKGNMSGSTMWKFQKARDFLRRGIYGTSWCRCAEHNAAEGGKSDSSHKFTESKESTAGDVTLVNPKTFRPMTGHEYFLLLIALREAGFNRFGLDPGKWFIHADSDATKPRETIWFY